ncbi:MAG: hypothetical protein JW967_10980 [Dehalococcoidales bacterium]|nr:hypothetical protein [Dehalococcoidales bacterium]
MAGVSGAKSSLQMTEALTELGMESRVFSLSECTLDTGKNTVLLNGNDLSVLDGIVVRKLGDPIDHLCQHRINLLHQLAFRGVRVFSSPEAIELANNRYSNTLKLKQAGVPVPNTIVTESVNEISDTVSRWNKAVLKPLFTSKGRGMLLLDANLACRLTLKHWQDTGRYPYYLQEFISAKEDMGIAFLGGKYIGAFKRIAGAESWQTTIRTGGRYEPVTPSPEVVYLAEKAANTFPLDYTIVDVVFDGERYLVYEVSAFGGFSGLAAGNTNVAQLLAQYVKQNILVRQR